MTAWGCEMLLGRTAAAEVKQQITLTSKHNSQLLDVTAVVKEIPYPPPHTPDTMTRVQRPPVASLYDTKEMPQEQRERVRLPDCI